mgnify:CR=1 FL=1
MPRVKSDLERVDAYPLPALGDEALPELTDAMLARGVLRRAGRPLSDDPRRQVTIRLPASVLAAWKATGPGWQTRMAELLRKPRR